MLHGLRGDALRALPRGATTFLSAGCAGAWYFEWIAQCYPGLQRHVGVEAYSPKPEGLPSNAEWIEASVADMSPVPGASVDLVFSGQNIEHLPEREIGAFLRESHRVLRPGGLLVIDSPNRAITQLIGWFHPEHVLELRVEEARSLVELAGFEVESLHGLWQCYDASTHRVLPLDPGSDENENQRRVEAAVNDPENAFTWWLTARKTARQGDWQAVEAEVSRIAGHAYAGLRTRFHTQIGTLAHAAFFSEAQGARGAAGYLLYGPYMPLFPGRYHVVFRIRAIDRDQRLDRESKVLGHVDISSAYAKRDVARRDFDGRDLAAPDADGYSTFSYTFDVTEALFGKEFRVFTTGAVALAAAFPLQLTRVA